MLELMLNIEQPLAYRATKQRYRQMHEQKRLDSDPPHQACDDQRVCAVGRHGADPPPSSFAHRPERQPLAQ
jgi:hypothetical protein